MLKWLLVALVTVPGDDVRRWYRNDGRQFRNSPPTENTAPAGETPPDTLLAWMYPGDGNESCTCDEPAIASGQTPAIARASAATCSKKGLAGTGLVAGDYVVCSSNEWRAEPNSDGDLGLHFDGPAKTNRALRSDELDDAAWTSTAIDISGDEVESPRTGVFWERLEDDDPGGSQGISQTYAGADGTYVFSCHFQAGTLSAARLSIVGAGSGSQTCAVSGLAAGSWKRGVCSVATTGNVTVSLLIGANDAATGQIYAGGCQLEAVNPAFGVFASAYIPTEGSAVTRAAEAADLPLGEDNPDVGSAALTWEPVDTVGDQFWVGTGGNARVLYFPGPANFATYDGTNNPGVNAALAVGASKRYSVSWGADDGFIIRNETAATENTSAFTAASWGGSTFTIVGFLGSAPSGIYSRICLDDSRTGCQQ